MASTFRQKLDRGEFCHLVELVASQRITEERLLEISAELATLDLVDAAGVTSYAGGAPGRDPVQIALGAKSRGITPNIHLTCVYQDRDGLRQTLQELHRLGIHDVLAITGDYPKEDGENAVFDLDSVALVAMIDEMRQGGMPFSVSVAVSPFKYTEADCMYQYVKLEKKFAAGADFAITQIGYDVRKFRELKQYLDERDIPKPLIGNVYLLGERVAKIMSEGRPPGCWIPPQLLERVREEARVEDKGKAARLERAARTIAILRGLGYAGAYIWGTHNVEQIRWIIARGEELVPRWEEFADELTFAPTKTYYLYESGPERPKRFGLIPRTLKLAGRIFPVRSETLWRKLLRRMSGWVAGRPLAEGAVERFERAIKSPMFGCESCGNCVLGDMEFVCPETCPKRIRNGPCGGTANGQCEVIPEQACIWVEVYERAKTGDELELLKVYIPPPDRTLKGTSSWVNYFLDRDVRPRGG